MGRIEPLTLCFQDVANLNAQTRGIFCANIDQIRPFSGFFIDPRLMKKIAGLQNGFERIAQVVGEGSKTANGFIRHFRLGCSCLRHGQASLASI